ncbi:DUF2007 domain-containing protein [Acidobacteria bacterium AB60]|nr:DUF2007 domain-containing protein [Acidobacteria bacterium AB60]
MFEESPDQEWRRLTKLYGAMYDGQLLELAASLGDLTEMAQTVLRDELRKRGLGDPLAAGWSARERLDEHEAAEHGVEAPHGDATKRPVEYTWKVELCRCEDSTESWQVGEALRRAGIQCWLNPTQFPSDLRGPIVMVAADQLEEARAVIAQPIPQDIVDQSKEEVPEYEAPVCPSCGAADPVLISAEPSNAWECESCGREWTDAVDASAPSS